MEGSNLKAVLFDLDGTLLDSNFDRLLDNYFEGVSALFEKWISKEKFIKALMTSTYIMIKNDDVTKTNIEVFKDDFFSRTHLDPELMTLFDQYYIEEFPKLNYLSKANHAAVKAVDLAFASGLKVVVATNPVFPLTPILERLRWAKVADYEYDLITHGDNMHFCKPNLHYYQEISKLIGVAPEDCIMIGDDRENDGPAALVGMDTFIIEKGKTLTDATEYFMRSLG